MLDKNSDMCLQTDMDHVLAGLGNDLWMQSVTIGLLVFTYFAMKRNDNYNSQVSDFDYNEGGSQKLEAEDTYTNSKRQQCPQCNGSGVFAWPEGVEMCDLCDGNGFVDIPPKRTTLKLPPYTNRESF